MRAVELARLVAIGAVLAVGCGPTVALPEGATSASTTGAATTSSATTDLPSTQSTTDPPPATTLPEPSSTSVGESSTGPMLCTCGPNALELHAEAVAPSGPHLGLGTTITASGHVWSLRRLHDPPEQPIVLLRASPDGSASALRLPASFPTQAEDIHAFAGADDGLLLASVSSQDMTASDITLFDVNADVRCVQPTERRIEDITPQSDGTWLVHTAHDVGRVMGCEDDVQWVDDVLPSGASVEFVRWTDDILWTAGVDEAHAPFIRGLSTTTQRVEFSWQCAPRLPSPLRVAFEFDGSRFYFSRGDDLSAATIDAIDVQTGDEERYEVAPIDGGFILEAALLVDEATAWVLLQTDSAVEVHGLGEGCCVQSLGSPQGHLANQSALRAGRLVRAGVGADFTVRWYTQ